MDLLPDWAAHALSNHDNLRAYYPYARTAYSYLSLARSYALPLIDQVSRKPDLATIALLLVILFISLKILNMLWQTFMFWFRMARRVVFWGGLVGLGLWMYTRGPEGAVEDVGYWVEVWGREREYWVERERVARLGQQVRGGGPRGRGEGWF
ncbi:uncharacterized protein LTR77_009494 [Saxophila tyrrhenica]|uniref:Uncharacterized protein n=1 Tax=Saxophila tyrrhenica TaxID=1690608 RepID=A0AAV9P1X9_9PEZI|nr:hypothetical protein LTR77_009494 [Saxophila tyrrhenica]